ncbi:MAG TPA: glycosyltransferase family 4 protein [Pyrinomonadaceae bacterium]|nr:glycosyltransferase family 4 protein [Pyrinomonadaceae bacterium]
MPPEKRKKVIYIISHIDKAIGFEWIAEKLDKSRFDLSFILLNDKPSYLGRHLREKGIKVQEIPVAGKSTFPLALLKLINLLRKEKPDVIHTHMYVADIIGQLAGKFLGIKTRVYTRHSSNENRKYHKKQRIDNLVNSLTTHILAISENVKNILVTEENVAEEKIRLIYHGFDLEKFDTVSREEIEALSKKYNPQSKKPVIGVVARYSHWKGIQYAIGAFKRLLEDHPNALLLLANAKRGDFKDGIDALLTELPKDSFYEIEFEHNLFALYQLFDVYVHLPIDPQLEAFGQTYVEALAAGIPSVFTNSGIAREFIRDGENALIVGFEDSEQVYEAIVKLLEDKELREKLSETGKADVKELFSLEKMIGKLEKLYSE